MIKREFAGFFFCVTALTFTLGGCTPIKAFNDYEPPIIDIVSFQMIPSKGVAPEFELTLCVTNPNAFDLPLQGIVYRLLVKDYRIFTGVSKDLPLVPGYEKKEIVLSGSWNLLNSVGAAANFFRTTKDFRNISYAVDIKLDMGSLYPPLRIHKEIKMAEVMEISP